MQDIEVLASLEASFELGEVLGEGGFGVVLRGTPRAGGAPVAIKLTRGVQDAETSRRILREAELAVGLGVPGLVGFRGLFRTESDGLALVYDLVPGVPLSRELGVPLARDRVLSWLEQLARALDGLHQGGLVHRDLKAENVMVRPDGSLVLLDLGLLRATGGGSTVTATGMLLGTPAVMAPELFAGEPATPASDLYALACLAFHMLTGRPAFPGSPGEILRQQRKGALESLLRESPQLDGLRASFRGALGPASARPDRCLDFVRALRAGKAPESKATVVLAPEVAVREPPRVPRKREAWGVLLLLFLGVVGGLSWSGSRERGSASPVAATPEPGGRETAPEAVRSPLGEGLRAAIRDWESLSSEGFLPLQDPLRAEGMRGEVPELEEFLARIEAEGLPARWDPRVLSELRQLDQEIEAEAGIRPLAPFLDAAPLEELRDLREIASRFGVAPEFYGELFRSRRGWFARAWTELDRARGAYEALEAEYEARDRRVPPGFPAADFLTLTATRLSFQGLLTQAMETREQRCFLSRYLRTVIQPLARALLAWGRALEEEEVPLEIVGRVLRDGFERMNHSLPFVIGLPRVEAAMGGSPRSAGGRLVAGRVLLASRTSGLRLDIPPGRTRPEDPYLDPLLAKPLESRQDVVLHREVLDRKLYAWSRAWREATGKRSNEVLVAEEFYSLVEKALPEVEVAAGIPEVEPLLQRSSLLLFAKHVEDAAALASLPPSPEWQDLVRRLIEELEVQARLREAAGKAATEVRRKQAALRRLVD